MYLEYKTTATWSKKDVMIDFVRAMTGVYTSVSQFSSSCDKTVTNFASTVVAPGWTMVDDQSALATDPFFIISAPDAAGVTKLIKVVYSTANLYVGFFGCTSYNSTTKVTDTAACDSSIGGKNGAIRAVTSSSLATVFRLSVSPRYICMMSYVGGNHNYDTTNGYIHPVVAYELPRPAGSAYWDAANGKSTLVVGFNAQNLMTASAPQYGYTSTPGEWKMSGTNANSAINWATISLTTIFNAALSGATGTGKNLFGNATGVGAYARVAAPPLSINGFVENSVKYIPNIDGLAIFDEVTIDGITYVVSGNQSSPQTLLIPKV